ncbi:MAG: hypothetical protein M0Q01_07945 [Syntrophales bacterium]|jgi:hypothetical protein|nr:hypothetical protein [Syntrophales bacterium]
MWKRKDKRRDYLIKAVSPSLFSAALHPDLIIALIIANLMSPKLWELAQLIPAGDRANPEVMMKRLHKFVNRNFYHPNPSDFCRVWGLYERETVTDPDELASSDWAMSIIRQGIEITRNRDVDFVIGLLDNSTAPRYIYPTVDLILAATPTLQELKPPVLGMTACLDECVLIASLALAGGLCKMEDIVFVGSPLHYTLYLFPDEEGYMFNAKREFSRRQDWIKQSGGEPDASRRLFMEKLFVCDRIITPFGYCVFPDGSVTITPERMENVVKRISRFLAATPPELSQALATVRKAQATGLAGADRIDSLPALSCASIEAAVLADMDNPDYPLFEAALYVFRHPQVNEPELYEEAAMRGFRSYILSGAVFCPADAREIVAGISGNESVYGESLRVAMPDEVLAFDTASCKEKKLLEETLLRHAHIF